MQENELIATNSESTVIAKFAQKPHKERMYESEADLESLFINILQRQGFEYAAHIKDESALLKNLKTQLEKLNDCTFSDKDFQNLLDNNICKKNDNIQDKSEIVQKHHIFDFEFESGEHKNIYLADKIILAKNSIQVINQYSANGINRYDVSILVNGLPLVHIELKKRGVDLKEAFNQISRYHHESFHSSSGIFNFVQIFIISNGILTKYYSNTSRDLQARKMGESNFALTNFWADKENHHITDLTDFAEYFCNKRTLLNVLFKYCVFSVEKKLLAMRPYQITATEAIISKITMSLNAKKFGTKEACGYIWHSTGSGKTLTSFKTAQLASQIQGIEKVLFVVDRKDLDDQTIQEYNRFEEGCVASNRSTRILESQLQDLKRKIIVTTIQKLSIFVNRNKNHALFNAPCVIIFDECHRNQFGEMNAAIKKAFKKHFLFGFTGTPILEENKSSALVNIYDKAVTQGLTTKDIFGDYLHAYTIADAIRDKSVLPFKVDYHNVLPKFKQDEKSTNLSEKEQERLEKTALNHKDRIKEIVHFVLEHFNQKTYNREFNSIFASQSIESAKLYYAEFQKQNKTLPNPLKIAVIFSVASNEDDGEGLENVSDLPQNSREFLEKAINDYNAYFGTNFSTSAEQFPQYYRDLSKKMKEKELDLLIVVDMFLTGFDAKRLNTLWVDKNLKFHRLLQAYSRTNRTINSIKTHGNIVCFRDLQDATNESIKLFSRPDSNESAIVLLRSFKEYFEGYIEQSYENGLFKEIYHKGYKEMVEHFKETFPEPSQVVSDTNAQKSEFIKLTNEILKMENTLRVFDEFTQPEFKLIDDRLRQDVKSVYLYIKDEFKTPEIPPEFENLSFEIDYLGTDDINLDFILDLIQKFKTEDDDESLLKIELKRWLDGSIKLRDKRDLIEDFAAYAWNLGEIKDIDKEFKSFVKKRKKAEFQQIANAWNLDWQKAQKFMQTSFNRGFLSDLGTDFEAILPKMSLFNKDSKAKREEIFATLNAFYEKYKDFSNPEIKELK